MNNTLDLSCLPTEIREMIYTRVITCHAISKHLKAEIMLEWLTRRINECVYLTIFRSVESARIQLACVLEDVQNRDSLDAEIKSHSVEVLQTFAIRFEEYPDTALMNMEVITSVCFYVFRLLQIADLHISDLVKAVAQCDWIQGKDEKDLVIKLIHSIYSDTYIDLSWTRNLDCWKPIIVATLQLVLLSPTITDLDNESILYIFQNSIADVERTILNCWELWVSNLRCIPQKRCVLLQCAFCD